MRMADSLSSGAPALSSRLRSTLRGSLEYRDMSAAGTADEPTRAPHEARDHHVESSYSAHYGLCRTVPRLATGNLRFSYPQTLSGGASACRRLPVATLASASLSEASVRLPFLSSLTAEGRCGMDSSESQNQTGYRCRAVVTPVLAKHPNSGSVLSCVANPVLSMS